MEKPKRIITEYDWDKCGQVEIWADTVLQLILRLTIDRLTAVFRTGQRRVAFARLTLSKI